MLILRETCNMSMFLLADQNKPYKIIGIIAENLQNGGGLMLLEFKTKIINHLRMK